jgi:DNA-binding transcriptional ArsR family regulator
MTDDLLERIRTEIETRCAELRPRVEEYQQLLSAAEALGLPTAETSTRAARAVKPAKAKAARKAPAKARAARRKSTAAEASSPASSRAPRGAAQTAILAALEHGSHTVAELGVVTAMSGQNIRENLRRLLGAGAITRAKREGKAAYALAARSH